MRDMLPVIIGIIAVAALIIVVMMMRKGKKKDECPIDIDVLIKALGGSCNISGVESGPTRLKVKVLEENKLDIEAIKGLGASGIVQGNHSLTMIFGKASPIIEYELTKSIQ
ncbi:MAG: hypothetical protein ACSW8B_01210 [bacterium]